MEKQKIIYSAVGVFLLLVLWQIMSFFMPKLVVASPVDTFITLAGMISDKAFWYHLSISAARIFSGIIIGSFIGFLFGIIAGFNKKVKYILNPLKWVLMSVPAVITVVLAMLWFGMGTKMVIFITSLMLSPLVYVNTVKGIEMVDDSLLEMAQLYRLNLILKLKHVYIPAISGPLVSALTLVIGTGVRIVVLAEVLGTSEGIGYSLSLARTNLEIPELFSWVIICIGVVAFIEFVFLKPFQDYVLRWKK